MLLATIVAVLAGVIAILANMFMRISFWGGGRRSNDNKGGGVLILILGILAAILAPIAATMVRLAISRKREFLADADGALLTRYPEGLARALEKISQDATPMKVKNDATANLFIDSPYKGKQKMSWFTKLFMTHPPVEERISALRGMDLN
jgi:heat shock protein HtpX